MAHRLIDPASRDTFPKIWRGFDLVGMKSGDVFYGCEKCGVQTPVTNCCVNQCPNCLGEMTHYSVTVADLRGVKTSPDGVILHP